MQQINTTYQTLQTNHQQFKNQHDQLTEYIKNKNTVEYRPNSSNSLDVELRKVETYYDWLKEVFNLRTQTIEKGANYVESLLNHKEKVQAELIQQNRELEETKNTMKDLFSPTP
jgi:seryl-tRNA synthetase